MKFCSARQIKRRLRVTFGDKSMKHKWITSFRWNLQVIWSRRDKQQKSLDFKTNSSKVILIKWRKLKMSDIRLARILMIKQKHWRSLIYKIFLSMKNRLKSWEILFKIVNVRLLSSLLKSLMLETMVLKKPADLEKSVKNWESRFQSLKSKVCMSYKFLGAN